MPNETKQAIINRSTLTIICCALACEAKPLIDFFKLKKDTNIHAFSVFHSGSVLLIVSGMGQHNMSAAVNWLNGYLNSSKTQFWLNVGVAGHQSANIGSLFCTHKISSQHQTLYPTKWLKHKIKLEQLLTVYEEEEKYPDNHLYDMEGFAFYQAATRFNSQECVQCLKIVSDNKEHSSNRDKSFISDLIAHHCDAIVSFIDLHTNALEELNSEAHNFDKFKLRILNNIHFSHSQQLQLSTLLQAAQSHHILLNTLNLENEKHAKPVLQLIKQHLDTHAVTL